MNVSRPQNELPLILHHPRMEGNHHTCSVNQVEAPLSLYFPTFGTNLAEVQPSTQVFVMNTLENMPSCTSFVVELPNTESTNLLLSILFEVKVMH